MYDVGFQLDTRYFPKSKIRNLIMIQYIKSGKTVNEKRDIDQQVAKTVETILADIEARGWAAIRDYSEKFDKWNPKTFKLSGAEIQACMGSLTAQDIEDIKFAQTQIKRFAQIQMMGLRDVEVETLPGVILGHKNIPINRVGAYVPGGKYPLLASAHMGILTAKVAVCGLENSLKPIPINAF